MSHDQNWTAEYIRLTGDVQPDRHYQWPAIMDTLPAVQEWVENLIEIYPLSVKQCFQIGVVLEEIVVNIIHYAYPDEEPGIFLVTVSALSDRLRMQFIDAGPAFDPLAADDPDLSAGLEDRRVGGLGIFMVRRMADSVAYRRVESRWNELTVELKFEARLNE